MIPCHYFPDTVLPLGNLMIGINPRSQHVERMQEIVNLWKDRMHIQLVYQEEYMLYGPFEGWSGIGEVVQTRGRQQTEVAPTNSTDWYLDKKSSKYKLKAHKRFQSAFTIYCIQQMLNRSAGHTILLDTDEYLVNNYISPGENYSKYSYRRIYRKTNVIDTARVAAKPFRIALPSMAQRVTIVDLLSNFTGPTWGNSAPRDRHKPKDLCIRVPAIHMSSVESGNARRHDTFTPGFVNRDHLTTLRHTMHGRKEGYFSKAILHLDAKKFPAEQVADPAMYFGIHNPSRYACGYNAPLQSGTDYISSTWRIQHYKTGTIESILERGSDARYNDSNLVMTFFKDRNRDPIEGEDFNIFGWVAWFIEKVGEKESKRLLFSPLEKAYKRFSIHPYKEFEQHLKSNKSVAMWNEEVS